MTRAKEARKALLSAFPYTIPVLTGFLALGLAYGILMDGIGYGPAWSGAMSAVAYCGSMQFAAVSLMAGAFEPLQALLLSLMVNFRHLFYGLSMLDKYKNMGWARGLLVFTLCDETFSIASGIEAPEGVNRKYFYVAISVLDYLYWIAGTLLGGFLGSFLPGAPEGLDFALTALFVVLFIEAIKARESAICAALGVGVSAACLVLFGADGFVIPSLLLSSLLLSVGRRRMLS